MIGIILLGFNVNAQKICGFDAYLQKELRADPAFRSRLAAFEKIWQEKQALLNNTANRVIINGTDTVYEIPVVFQVIHTGTAIGTRYNPTYAKLDSVVNYLNQVFGATYPAYPDVNNGGVNIPLRFVLAKRDPSCNPTDGINRIDVHTVLSGAALTAYINHGVNSDNTNGISDATLKGIVQWDPSLYYNIWLVNKIDSWNAYDPGGGVDGYAQFAGGTPATDGTVIIEGANRAGGTTLPHELGHAFNLYHVFSDVCPPVGADCATTGDFVCDTDPQLVDFDCPTGISSCGSPWFPTIKNIMSYANCTDRFTAGQRARVRAALLTQRGSLIYSLGGTAIGAQATYPQPIALSGCTNPGMTNLGNTLNSGPSTVQIADMQYFSQGYTGDEAQFYIDRTIASCHNEAAVPAHMTIGQMYPVAIGTGSDPENVKVWIDFNNDGTFDPITELVYDSPGISGDSYKIHTGNTIVIPPSANTTVPLRMRVISDFYSNTILSACGGTLEYGQTEDYAVKINPAPIPTSIMLKNIKAQAAADNKSIDVSWEVTIPNDLTNFEIESSLDGRIFSKIGSIAANVYTSAYLFNDANPYLNTVNYYRIKMIEKNKETIYSNIVFASINDNSTIVTNQLKIYPNPVAHLINVVAPQSGSFEMNIKNDLGQVVYTKSKLEIKQGIPATIDLTSSSLTSGVYYLQLKEKNGLSLTGKFVKK